MGDVRPEYWMGLDVAVFLFFATFDVDRQLTVFDHRQSFFTSDSGRVLTLSWGHARQSSIHSVSVRVFRDG
ncbi:hypothetical protein pCPXV0294 [Cowpox virus]|uniref:Uncharacterized protein n=1 Tax=Cowpox virus TaxID=10243 RepID=A0A212PNB4_COWPX|nr:hypothetical protein pCPXV0294 [Cowpox virus]SNB48688.1 hypothetical protein pCPXV0294 [Cowpox virus]